MFNQNFKLRIFYALIIRFNTIPFTLSDFLASILSKYNTRFELNKIKNFLDNNELGVAQSTYGPVIESINTNIRWMDNNFELINQWLVDNQTE